MSKPTSSKLAWAITAVFAAISAVAIVAWIQDWDIPDLTHPFSDPETTKDQLAWATACDAVRARLKYPTESTFPSAPPAEIIPSDRYSMKFSTLKIGAINGDLLLATGKADEYYQWRQETLARVELTRESDGWVAVAWVDAPNAMNVRGRIAWIVSVTYDERTDSFRATDVELIDTNK